MSVTETALRAASVEGKKKKLKLAVIHGILFKEAVSET